MVNKATLRPEFEDTILRVVNNPWDFGLETGDRAHVIVHFYYDAYSGKSTEWDIVSVVEEIPVLPITARDEIDADSYDMLFTGLADYELYDRYVHAAWVWENRLNVNVAYKGVPETAEFAMSVRGVSNDTIDVNVLARTAESSDTAKTRLLTFDLNGIGNHLTNEEKMAVKEYETLKFRLHFKVKDGIEGSYKILSYPVTRGDIENALR